MKCVVFIGALALFTVSYGEMRIERLDRDIYRVRMARDGVWTESLMNRYAAIEKLSPEAIAALPEGLALPVMKQTEKGFELAFALESGERLYGLGDSGRDHLNRRGNAYDLWVVADTSPFPFPMILSSRGWGLLVNCTAKSHWDCGKTDASRLVISCDLGEIDFYLFKGAGYRELLERYTRLTGRPQLPPLFALGHTFVANQWVDQYQAVEEVYRFRDKEYPCDVYSLEPGWMEYFYDSSTRKDWNKRFEFQKWQLDEGCFGTTSWVGAFNRMKMKLCLWLCMDYDLFVYEEDCAEGRAEKGRKYVAPQDRSNTGFLDTRTRDSDDEKIGLLPETDSEKVLRAEIGNARRQMARRPDRLTGRKQSGEEPWFNHLRKFVDVGVRGFKLDGAWQTATFAKRKWAGKYSDGLVHNLYAYLNGKQLSEGFSYYRELRPFIFSAAGYVGSQRYTLSWAGDTGGGIKPMLSALTLGCSGYPFQSCDTTIDDIDSVHYGTFSPWMMQNNWDYHQQPWYRPKDDFKAICEYVRLRYRLLPYIYTAAYRSSQTGWPMMVPLALAYPEQEEYADLSTTYLFGPDLLVSAFANETVIPPGDWYDFFTGEKVTGPCRVPFKRSATRGGGLFVRAGAVIPMWPQRLYVEKGWNEELELHVWPGEGRGELYEDDGESLDYLKGCGRLSVFESKDGVVRLVETKGSFVGMPDAKRPFAVVREPVVSCSKNCQEKTK